MAHFRRRHFAKSAYLPGRGAISFPLAKQFSSHKEQSTVRFAALKDDYLCAVFRFSIVVVGDKGCHRPSVLWK